MAGQFKTLRVIGKRHRIEWDVEDLKDDDGDDAEGLFLSSKKLIRLSAGLTHDDERETLLHELIHALEVQMNAEIPEAVVRQLGVGLYAVLKDNPRLVSYLLEEERDGEAGDTDRRMVGDNHGSGRSAGSGRDVSPQGVPDGPEHRADARLGERQREGGG